MTETTQVRRPVIVVGVDGSEASKDALRWAVVQAGLTSADVHAQMAWQVPGTYGLVPLYPYDFDIEGATAKALEEVVDEMFGADRPLGLTTQVVEGHPVSTLVEAAKGAALLVVGSRGHGAFAGMLLGSVSEHCVAHASCPVVVVRHPAANGSAAVAG
ncbi:MAG: universal stress protein [Actinomycetota bacterium]|nr:universal stress protein [Actinomycetota bacterium]